MSASQSGIRAALATGMRLGGARVRFRLLLLAKDPLHQLSAMTVEALSLVLHPWRNGTRLLLAVHRFLAQSRTERLHGIGEAIATAPLILLVLPWLSELRGWLRRVETFESGERLERVMSLSDRLPAARTRVGEAVNQAVMATPHGTIPAPLAVTSGSLEALWINSTRGDNRAMEAVCALIRAEASLEVCFQTYIFDPHSQASHLLLSVLAEKQRHNSAFRIAAVVDHPGLEAAMRGYGIRAHVAIARPPLSRRGQHTKMFVIDARWGVLGGDNINNPREKDLLVTLRGPVVSAMLADFDDAWACAARHVGEKSLPPHPVDDSPVPADAVPITLLTKRGVARLLSWDYLENEADQGLLAALHAARYSLKIETPALNADPVLSALRRAARRGVRIRICLPLKQHTALASLLDAADNHAFVAFWAQLPEAERRHIEIRNYSSNGRSPEENHTKFVCVDDQWAYVGSQNLDNQSFSYSREVGIGIDDPALARRLSTEVFDRDWETSLAISDGWLERWVPYSLFYH